jgi:hypothetical protein
MQQFNSWVYRQETFFPVKFVIPTGGMTSHTRFRFYQYFFESARDAWAIDNVRVFRYLPNDWHDSSGFMANLKKAYKQVQFAQCCFDTDWCQSRLSDEEMSQCFQFPWYTGKNYELRGSEMYICFALLINVIKFVLISAQEWLIRKRLPFHDELQELFKLEWFYKNLPPRFRPKRTLEEYAANVHLSARLVAELRDAFDDGEGAVVAVVMGDEGVDGPADLDFVSLEEVGDPIGGGFADFGGVLDVFSRFFDGIGHLHQGEGFLGGKKEGFDDGDQFHK